MSRQAMSAPIQRILVALDASAASGVALGAAVRLAAKMEAELLGLFVEDINLLRFAGLPFAREVGFPTARTRRMGSADMESALRAQASLAQEALTAAARGQHLRCAFRVVRGEVSAQLLEAAHEVDLLVIGLKTRDVRRVGVAVREIITAASRPVLILPAGADVRPPILVFYDGSPGSAQALSAATRLVQMEGGVLTVLYPASERRLPEEIAGSFGGIGVALRYRGLARTDVAGLAYAAHTEAAGVLVLGEGFPLEAGALENLLGRLNCAVLLAR